MRQPEWLLRSIRDARRSVNEPISADDERLDRVIQEAGATLRQDFFHYLITRQILTTAANQIVSMLRHLFADEVLMPTAIESTAVEAAAWPSVVYMS